ncbi:MAG: YkgJ family cysteine cluster protein [Pseudomonadales bacterium]
MTELSNVIEVLPVADFESDNTCGQCSKSLCCRYITVPIDSPRSMREYDNLLWMVSHRGVRVYRDVDGWGIQTMNSCEHLLPGGGCGIYDTRPIVCREHSNDDCEFVREEDDSVLEFNSHASLDEYCRQKFKSWDKRFKLEGVEGV